MNLREYEVMYHVEDSHWWYRSLRAHLLDALGRYVAVSPARVLDAGCGTGANLAALPAPVKCFGIDFAIEAVHFCRKRGLTATAAASALGLPFRDASMDAVISCDVLSHQSIPDKHAALLEMIRVLKPGGVIILNLPAFQWLMSSHDAAIHADRRFSRSEVRDLLAGAGCDPLEVRYWNALLFPILAATRLWRRVRPRAASDLDGSTGRSLSAPLTVILDVERAVGRVVPWPAGLSVFAVARKR